MTRRFFFGFVATLLVLLGLSPDQASAQSVRYFVERQGDGRVYEVKPGSATGGAFVNYRRPSTVSGLRVHGYTDRAARGEWLFTRVTGGSRAEYVQVVSDNGIINIYVPNLRLPAWAVNRVSINPLADNITVKVKLPRKAERSFRLPVGTR
jgi:hypothetical protein